MQYPENLLLDTSLHFLSQDWRSITTSLKHKIPEILLKNNIRFLNLGRMRHQRTHTQRERCGSNYYQCGSEEIPQVFQEEEIKQGE
jgi:hypothetical protein